MKILALRFKNLNSLQGEWFIDFSTPDFTSNGIFAITGPTGSGKSTILDAICLALYGHTPRLGKVTKSSNEIMSRQSGECFAEVLFETQKGKFRCHWSQHKAHKKADGNLTDPKHEISDAITGQVLETKRTLVLKEIEERTGMSFKRFTRSILLAQGGFSVFLQATPDDRAPILEQITGTEIYSLISQKVFERYSIENDNLKLLKAETSGVIVLSADDETKITSELGVKQKDETLIAKEYSKTDKAIQWLTNIDRLQKELTNISIETKEHTEKIAAFKPIQEELQKANQAAELDGEYATLTATRSQQTKEQKILEQNNRKLPKLEESLLEHEKLLITSEKKKINLKEQQKLEAPILQKVRSLDLKSVEKAKAIVVAEADNKKIKKQITKNRSELNKISKKHKETEKEQEKIQKYLASNSNDEVLTTQFEAITELINYLKLVSNEHLSRNEKLVKEQKFIKKIAKQFATKEKEYNTTNKETEKCQKEIEKQKDKLEKLLKGRLLREYRSDYNTLIKEIGYIKQIASYEEARKKLEDGKPCELCGSREHPYAIGNIPVADEKEKECNLITKLIEQAENLETAIKKLEEKLKKLQKKKLVAFEKFTQATHEKEISEKNLKQFKDEVEIAEKKIIKAKEQTLKKLKPYGITKIPEVKPETILLSLKQRLENWQTYKAKQDKFDGQLAQLVSDRKNIEGIISTIELTLKDKKDTLTKLIQEQELLLSEREKVYGKKNPDNEEALLEKQVTKAEKAEKQALENHAQVKLQLSQIKTLITSLNESISKRVTILEALEKEFTSNLVKIGFINEVAFSNSRMTIEKRKELAEQYKKLEDKKSEITSRKLDREARLKLELDKKLTDESLDTLKEALDKDGQTLKSLREEIGSLKQRLSDNKKAKEIIKDKKLLIDRQDLECLKWNRLYTLIGSKNGKKYRNFAQGITFELMVKQANQQLERMTDRYLLVRDKNEPLELNVIDNYQAGEVRSTKNLSGGESFIVSLALALGLSKMASHRVRVDSLFLDEGFGTLDNEALETALETLSTLQHDGKLIGVISHVSALKERISTQINIHPISGGRSTISGPGVSNQKSYSIC